MGKRLLRHTYSLLHVDYVKLNNKWNYDSVMSPYFRIYYIDEGSGIVATEHEKVKLEPDYLYIIPSFTLCHLRCEDYLSQYFIHVFEESTEGLSLFANNRKIIKVPASLVDALQFKRLLEINPGRGINRSDNPKVYENNVYYKGYQELNNLVSTHVFMETQGVLLQIIARFVSSHLFEQQRVGAPPSKIMDTISFIQLNLKEKLTVEALAKRVTLHSDYFSRLFFRYTGQRPIEYIHEKRIERAQYLIATTDLSFDKISDEIGFESLQYFSRVFKKVTSATPGEYKKQNDLFVSHDRSSYQES